MAGENKVEVIVSTQDRSTTALNNIKNAVTGMVAAFATWEITTQIKEAALLAARVETLAVVMHTVGNNAGYTASQMDGFTAQIKKMGITSQESMSSLIKMASANMDLSKASALARIAQDAAVIGNINSSEAFGRMIHGIRSGEVEILRTIGINVNFEQSYKKLADTLGKVPNDLSVIEKTQARVNAVQEFGVNISGAYEASMSTAGKQLLSMARYTEELKLKTGELFTPALTLAVMELVKSLKELDTQLGNNKTTMNAFGSGLADSFRFARRELSQFAAFLDKLGGTATQILAALYGPGMMAGNQHSTEMFDKMMALNKMYEERYKANKYQSVEDSATIGNTEVDQADIAWRKAKEISLEMQKIRAGNAQRAKEARDAEAEANKKAMAEAEGQYQQYLNWFASMKNKTADNAPEQNQFLKDLRDIDDEIEKQVRLTPQYAKSIREVGKETKDSLIKKNERENEAEWQKNPFQYQTIEQYNKELASTRALELEINLARIDAEEKSLSITSGEAARQRITALQESLEIKKAEYEIESNDTEVTQVKKLELRREIGQVERQIADNRETLINSGADFFGGFGRGLHDLAIQQKGFYEQGRDMARQTAAAMQSAMADGFFDIMQGKFNNLGKVIQNFLLSIQRMIANFFAQQATQALINNFGSALGFGIGAGGGQAAAGGSSAGYRSNGWNNTGAATVTLHDGGLVPRFHFGGLASDEVPAILQTGERVLDREHNALLERFANKAGGSGNVQINIINQSGQQLEVEHQGQPRFDGAQMIVDVVVKRLRSDPGFRSALATGGAY